MKAILKIIKHKSRADSSGVTNYLFGCLMFLFIICLIYAELLYINGIQSAQYLDDALTDTTLGSTLVNPIEYAMSSNLVVSDHLYSRATSDVDKIKVYKSVYPLKVKSKDTSRSQYSYYGIYAFNSYSDAYNMIVNSIKNTDGEITGNFNAGHAHYVFNELIQSNLNVTEKPNSKGKYYIIPEKNGYLNKYYSTDGVTWNENFVTLENFTIYNKFEFLVGNFYSSGTTMTDRSTHKVDGMHISNGKAVKDSLNTTLYNTSDSTIPLWKMQELRDRGAIRQIIVAYTWNPSKGSNGGFDTKIYVESQYASEVSGETGSFDGFLTVKPFVKDNSDYSLTIKETTICSQVSFYIETGFDFIGTGNYYTEVSPARVSYASQANAEIVATD